MESTARVILDADAGCVNQINASTNRLGKMPESPEDVNRQLKIIGTVERVGDDSLLLYSVSLQPSCSLVKRIGFFTHMKLIPL